MKIADVTESRVQATLLFCICVNVLVTVWRRKMNITALKQQRDISCKLVFVSPVKESQA